MKRFLNMTIATPEGVIFEGEVESAEFPGTVGSFTLLPMHAALISSLEEGKIIYIKEGKPIEVAIKGGFVEVKQDAVSVCVEQ
ncbi:FoF1 ATP synthase subunit delta/epsilon [Phocaeicola sp.]